MICTHHHRRAAPPFMSLRRSCALVVLLLLMGCLIVSGEHVPSDDDRHSASATHAHEPHRRRRSVPPTFQVEFSEGPIPQEMLTVHPLTIPQHPPKPHNPNDQEKASVGLSVEREGWQRVRLGNGTHYLCYVPSPEDIALEEALQEQKEGGDGNVAADGRRKRGAIVSPTTTHSLRLQMGGRCAIKAQDWWTYEACWEKNVRQYHINQQQNAATMEKEYFLGKGPEMHVEDGAGYDLTYGEHPSYGPYVSTTFYNGTECDLTGTPRQTEVRLFCSDGAPQQAGESIQVSEPRTCQYLVLWWSARACVPLLQREVGVHLPIRCYEHL